MTDMASRPSAEPRASGRATPRYRAFLSYSHRDARLAGWLHGALERYRVAKAMVGRVTPAGPVPARLTPIFRDRSELAASDDLGADIRDALAASLCLIVLCSPAAADSRWTNEEIAEFKRRHPDGRVLAAIAAGEPFAGEMPGREAEECFPHALRHRFGPDGKPTGERAEPIAADFREGGDGRRMGLLKLVAGMLGVGLDELARRETQRRQNRLAWLAAASLAGMALTSGLTVAAIEARDEARDQRAEAEGLIGFMLGDLRAKLEPVGRLDALDAVGTRALGYYQRQDEGGLTDAALLQRARALTLIGEIANRRGDLDAALRRYREARGATREALRRQPNDEQRIFDHAQNIYWVGNIAWQRGQTRDAERHWTDYRRLADRLLQLNPGKAEWRLERVYADTNLGMLLFEEGDFPRARVAFQSALEDAERIAASAPANRAHKDILSETLAYLADAQRDAGDMAGAMASRKRQLDILLRMASEDAADADVQRKLMVVRRALGHLFTERGNMAAGMAEFRQALSISERLHALEPENTEWLQVGAGLRGDLARLMLDLGRPADADQLIEASCQVIEDLRDRDHTVVKWAVVQRAECLRLRAQAAAARGRRRDALNMLQQAASRLGPRAVDRAQASVLSAIQLSAGDHHAALGNASAARRAWHTAFSALPNRRLPPRDEFRRFQLLQRLGRDREAAALARWLDSVGFRHPEYIRTKEP